jgi:type VI secretion system protein ImpC
LQTCSGRNAPQVANLLRQKCSAGCKPAPAENIGRSPRFILDACRQIIMEDNMAKQQDTSLLAQVMEQTIKQSEEDDNKAAQKGLKSLFAEIQPKGEKVNKAVIEQMIAKIDNKLSQQLDEILHHQEFQKMESAWRGLKFVIDRTNFRENIKIELLNVSKQDLLDDFEKSLEIIKSGLYKQINAANRTPVGAMIANYEFSPLAPDIKLLQNVAKVGANASAPFIAAAGPQFLDVEDLPHLNKEPQYRKWQSFRDSEDARYVGLTIPRFLLRLPYHPESKPVKAFNYEEKLRTSHDYLWGNTAYAFATRLTDNFAKYRWSTNIIDNGVVEDLPLHQYETKTGKIKTQIPIEILISEQRGYELAEQGFIPLTMHNKDSAVFLSANSVQKPNNW